MRPLCRTLVLSVLTWVTVHANASNWNQAALFHTATSSNLELTADHSSTQELASTKDTPASTADHSSTPQPEDTAASTTDDSNTPQPVIINDTVMWNEDYRNALQTPSTKDTLAPIADDSSAPQPGVVNNTIRLNEDDRNALQTPSTKNTPAPPSDYTSSSTPQTAGTNNTPETSTDNIRILQPATNDSLLSTADHSSTPQPGRAIAGGCPDDVPEPKFVHGSVCYQFVPLELTWINAQLHCQQQSWVSPGSLVTVQDAALQSWLAAQMTIVGWSSRYGVWLGLNNRRNASNFVWDQYGGKETSAMYTNWAFGEPSVFPGYNCAYMRPSYQWKWLAVPCNVPFFRIYNFICQYPIAFETVTQNTEIRRTIESTSTLETLAATVDQSSTSQTVNETATLDEDYRNALQTTPAEHTLTSTADNNSTPQPASTNNTPEAITDNIRTLQPAATNDSLLSTADDSSTLQPGHTIAGGCPDDVPEPKFVHGSVCYHFVPLELTWMNARLHCEQQSRVSPGSLVTVQTAALQSWLASQMTIVGWSNRYGVWLGLNNRRNASNFVWDQYGGKETSAMFTNWESGEPSVFPGNNCAYMRPSYQWKWLAVPCNIAFFRIYNFICQYPSAFETVTQTKEFRRTIESTIAHSTPILASDVRNTLQPIASEIPTATKENDFTLQPNVAHKDPTSTEYYRSTLHPPVTSDSLTIINDSGDTQGPSATSSNLEFTADHSSTQELVMINDTETWNEDYRNALQTTSTKAAPAPTADDSSSPLPGIVNNTVMMNEDDRNAFQTPSTVDTRASAADNSSTPQTAPAKDTLTSTADNNSTPQPASTKNTPETSTDNIRTQQPVVTNDSLLSTADSSSALQPGHAIAGGCPDDVPEPKLVHGSVCYQFVPLELTWMNARLHCQQQSRLSPGSLVTVQDAALQSWLASQMTIVGWSNPYGLWLGLNNRRNASNFVWDQYDGKETSAIYTNWEPGEPSVFPGNNCAYMRPRYTWKWRVIPCDIQIFRIYKFICQYPSTLETVTHTKEFRRTIESTISHETPILVVDVRNTLQPIASEIPTTTKENDFTLQPNVTSKNLKWTEYFNSTLHPPVTSDRLTFIKDSGDTQEPSIVRKTSMFTEDYRSTQKLTVSSETPTWTEDDPSTMQSSPLVEGRCPSDIPEPTFVYGGVCNQFVAERKTWVQAQEHCRQQSLISPGRLVNIHDAVMQNWLTSQMHVLGWNDEYGVWLGLNDRAKENDFLWDQYSGQGAQATYTNWLENEPDNTFNQDCVFMSPSYAWQWLDAECDRWLYRRYSFVCQYPLVSSAASTVAMVTAMTMHASNQSILAQLTSSLSSTAETARYTFEHSPMHETSTTTDHSDTFLSSTVPATAITMNRVNESTTASSMSPTSPVANTSAYTSEQLKLQLTSNLSVSCADRTRHGNLGLIEKPEGYSVGEEFIEMNCSVKQTLITWRCSYVSEFSAEWVAIRNESCLPNEEIERLAQANVTHATVTSILRETVHFMSLSISTDGKFNGTVSDVFFGSQILSNAISLVTQHPKQVALTDILTTVPAIVSKMLDASSDLVSESHASLSISRNVEALLAVASTELQVNDTVTLVQPNFLIQVTSDPEIIGIEVVSDGQLTDGTVKTIRTGHNGNQEQLDVMVVLAPEVKQLRKSFAVYNNAKLFQGKKMRPANDRIISVQLADHLQTTFSHPDLVTILYKLPNGLNQTSSYDDVECGFWNYLENDWSTFGCKKKPALQNHVTCTCNHTTNFAVLIVVHKVNPIQEVSYFALFIVTRTALSLSVALLLVVVISFLVLRKLRRTAAQKVLFSLSVSICLLDATFLIGVEKKGSEAACAAFAALMHVFLLSSFAWMSVQVSLQYFKLVNKAAKTPSLFFIKASIPAWGLPVFTVCTLLIVDYRLYDTSDEVCWIKGSMMHYGVLLPISLLIAYNGVLFILIARTFLYSNSLSVLSIINQNERPKRRTRADFTLFSLLGLTWTLAYFMVQRSDSTFQYLFSIFNLVQGIFITVLHFLLSKLLPTGLRRLLRHSSSIERSSDVSRIATFNSTFDNPFDQSDETTKT